MADSIRERIFSALLTRLGQINLVGGYQSNMGHRVFRGLQNLDINDMPACVLWPQVETVDNTYGEHFCETGLVVEGFALAGEQNPSVMQEKLLADIIKCLADPSVTISSLIDEISYVEGGPQSQPDAGETVVGVFAKFKIKYSTKLGDPYAQ